MPALAPAVTVALPPPGVGALFSGLTLREEELLREIEELFEVDASRVQQTYEAVLERAVKPLLVAGPETLTEVFQERFPVFAAYMVSFLSDLSLLRIYAVRPGEALERLGEIASLERRLFEAWTGALEERCMREGLPFEDLKYAGAQLFNYDLWLLEKTREVGLERFLSLLAERACDEAYQMHGYLLALLYVILAITAALLGTVPAFNRESLKVLVEWARHYAEELDSYVDTVNLLVTDEYYEAVEGYLREKGAR